MKTWGRLLTAMVTPFNDKLEVDFDKAVDLARYLIDEGTTALVVAGTTGEAPTLTNQEKIELFKVLKEKINVPIIAGIGTNSTRNTIQLAVEAEKCKVDGLMAVVPYYNKPNQDCLYKHFKAVAENVSLPLMLYNVPGRTGINMTAETVIKLSKIKNIVALKEASGNLDQAGKILRETSEEFIVYSGDDSLTLPMLSIGCYGIVSVASHVVGRDMSEMIEAYISGDVNKASKIHLRLLDVFKNLFITANPIPVKAALKIKGFDVGGLRLPLSEADEEVKKVLKQNLIDLGVIEP
ncbi:MAG: 4-hydroxy-tetrahydrodipicolinate synthase [Thermosediminibacterales bacterium]|nr:4-hydroxy-tetrahydrodipicolinate synthase [Thermosediminibacterales bacterium]MDK2836683.1 4-hydroxy-tetrahydrodipicolinate synthase [Thermosediminibacterales bacterium]